MTEVVARVDNEIWLQGRKATNPLLLVALPGRHVQVGQV